MPNEPRLLALDPALTTGVAWTSDEKVHPEFVETWDLRVRKSRGGRWDDLYRRLVEAAPRTIIYEDSVAILRYKSAVRIAAGLVATLELFSHRRGVPIYSVRPAELKRWASGSGAARKEAMVAEANRRFGTRFSPDEHDQADVLLLLAMALDKGLRP